MSQSQRKASPQIQQARRLALIDATMSAIAEHGFAGLTLSRIAGLAGLTAGTVNFYFTSKEALLLETLKCVADEYEQTISAALAAAGPEPAQRLSALVLTSFAPELIEPRKVAVWYAFLAEARAREDYHRICGMRDGQYTRMLTAHCAQLAELGPKRAPIDPRAIAYGLSGLIDELWQEVLFTPERYDVREARRQCMAFLASVFPWAYEMPAASRAARASGEVVARPVFRLERAGRAQLGELARLYDAYRQFYHQSADNDLARRFLARRFEMDDSVAFIALDEQDQGLGFVQLYRSSCSVAAADYYLLYDLYVDRGARGLGVGRALMQRAREHAEATGAVRIDLETAVDNVSAQALYESLGYRREQAFYKYSLTLQTGH